MKKERKEKKKKKKEERIQKTRTLESQKKEKRNEKRKERKNVEKEKERKERKKKEKTLKIELVYLKGLIQMADVERDLIEILEENDPIYTNKYTRYVRSPKCGAIATFEGTTRDTFEGKEVLELKYEAYVPMAIRCLKSLCSSARASWDIHSIAVAHCLGTVPVGETSVFVAVSSVHRADALDACKFLIDELKASVPIWKKEVYTNGEVWKENKEFIERMPGLGKTSHDQGGACSGKKKVEAHDRKSCCGTKVKVNDETSDSCS